MKYILTILAGCITMLYMIASFVPSRPIGPSITALPTPPSIVDASMGLATICQFTDFADFESRLQEIAADNRVNLRTVSNSYSNLYHLYWLEIGDTSKPTIFMQAGIHGGAEWQMPHIMLHFVNELLDSNSSQADFNEYTLEHFSLVIVPILNPNGHFGGTRHNGHGAAVPDIQNLDWHDNTNYGDYFGVDPNRNYSPGWEEYQNLPWSVEQYWNGQDYGIANYIMMPNGPVLEPSTQLYAYKGGAPFSEPETQLTKHIMDTYNIVVFLDWHTLNPWQTLNSSIIPKRYETDIQELINASRARVNARNTDEDMGDTLYYDLAGYDGGNPPIAQNYAVSRGILTFGWEVGTALPIPVYTDMYMELIYRSIEYISTHNP